MKLTSFFPVALSLIVAYSASAQTPNPRLAKVSTTKITQVKAGTLQTAKASWWGFNKADSTQALQDAIDSGVPKLVVDNTGSKWIVGKTIHLRSDQKIYFEDGVVVEAMKGKFKGKKDSLFQGKDVHNVVLEGRGHVTFQMQKADYDNPKLYEKAEWRHGIALFDCKNITLRNITVTKTGGDGLYLGDKKRNGFNQNIWVEKMNFDDNYRQGVSVISAQNLTIKDSRLTNTNGTLPMAGIDFEPNSKQQRLVNCVLDGCVFEGNANPGVITATGNLKVPITITVKNSYFKGNASGISATASQDASAGGKVLFENNHFDHQAVSIRNPRVDKIPHYFINNTFDFRASNIPANKGAINLTVKSDNMHEIIGNVFIKNDTVLADDFVSPVAFNAHKGGFGYPNIVSSHIEGTMFVKVGKDTRKINIPTFIAQTQQKSEKENPVNLLIKNYSKSLINNISKSWHFLPDPAKGKDVTSPHFDDSTWKVIDGGHRNWWNKQGIKYRGKAWYRKTVDVPNLSSNQKSTLYFNGIDGSAEVFVNGKKVGEHILDGISGWDRSFSFDVTSSVKAGHNLIAVAVISKPVGASGINEDVYLVTGAPR